MLSRALSRDKDMDIFTLHRKYSYLQRCEVYTFNNILQVIYILSNAIRIIYDTYGFYPRELNIFTA